MLQNLHEAKMALSKHEVVTNGSTHILMDKDLYPTPQKFSVIQCFDTKL